MFNPKRHPALVALLLMAFLLFGTAAVEAQPGRSYLKGKRKADEILAGVAIGGVCNGAIGTYMDRQQERLVYIPGTRVERLSDDTLLVHFNSDVLFGSRSANLDSAGRATLDQAADVINDYRKTAVVVQGHTDAVGSEEDNQDLSELRARSVQRYLAGRGVDSHRMTAIGFGESAPVASNGSSRGRQRNRRVDVLLKAKSGPLGQGS